MPPFDEDMPFQRRQWQIERIGWTLMAALVIAALAGVLGGRGPLARTSVGAIEYARFARLSAPTTVDVRVAAGTTGALRLRVSDEYLDRMTLRSIVPPPVSTELADRHHVFVFERSSLPGTVRIQLQLEPTTVGRASGWIGVDDAASVSFTHFIYP